MIEYLLSFGTDVKEFNLQIELYELQNKQLTSEELTLLTTTKVCCSKIHSVNVWVMGLLQHDSYSFKRICFFRICSTASTPNAAASTSSKRWNTSSSSTSADVSGSPWCSTSALPTATPTSQPSWGRTTSKRITSWEKFCSVNDVTTEVRSYLCSTTFNRTFLVFYHVSTIFYHCLQWSNNLCSLLRYYYLHLLTHLSCQEKILIFILILVSLNTVQFKLKNSTFYT